MERRMSGAVPVVIAAAAVIVGCAPSSPSGSPEPPPSETATHTVVVIGDSIPYNSPDDCPGCTGFADSYAEALGATEGEAYTAVNRSRHDGARTADIRDEVQSGSLDAVLSEAEVVIVSAGYNDQAPYEQGDCYDESINLDTTDGAASALLATTPECIATQTAATGATLASVLDGVRERAPDATLYALGSYNSWTGWSEFDALGPEIERPASQTIAAVLGAWRTVVCAEAERVDGTCVDLLTAFNGADGLTPAGDLLAADYNHPSQKGNDLIRDLLLED